MNARAESDVLVRPAGDVERVWVLEHVGVTIGRGNEPADTVVLFQHLAPHLDILRGDSLDRFHWRIVAQAFLGGQFGRPGRVLFQLRPLVGMLDEGECAVAQKVDGRLVACQQQKRGVNQHLMPVKMPCFSPLASTEMKSSRGLAMRSSTRGETYSIIPFMVSSKASSTQQPTLCLSSPAPSAPRK